MTLGLIAWRSLAFHWRRHAAVLLGVSVSGAILIGALVVGDTVRARLHTIAAARVGRIEIALQTGAFEVTPELGTRLARSLAVEAASVLRVAGTAASGDGRLRVGRVQVLGVDQAFWDLGSSGGALCSG